MGLDLMGEFEPGTSYYVQISFDGADDFTFSVDGEIICRRPWWRRVLVWMRSHL